MAAVLVLSRPKTGVLHLFTVETTTGPIIVVYSDESRLLAMAAAVQAILDPKQAGLRQMDLGHDDLDDCIEVLIENFPDAAAKCISDEHELWPKMLAGMQASTQITLPPEPG